MVFLTVREKLPTFWGIMGDKKGWFNRIHNPPKWGKKTVYATVYAPVENAPTPLSGEKMPWKQVSFPHYPQTFPQGGWQVQDLYDWVYITHSDNP